MTRYTSVTDRDRREMLAAIGASSVEELFAEVPAEVRLGRDLELPAGMAETEVHDLLAGLARRNADADRELCFIGAGMYDHYVPAVVDAITQRSEFLTPYTPYQPEVSQGHLQAMFEFQTAMSELTGLPVSNASLYEGPSSVASAGYLAIAATGRRRFVASRGVHPHSREALATYSTGFGAAIAEVGLRDGLTDAEDLVEALDEDTAAVFLQSPNFLGSVEDVAALAEHARNVGALLVVSVDPMTLGVLRPPGECGADIVAGEGQALGVPMSFGGPYLGVFATQEKYMRQMPGRLVGATLDREGRTGYVLTLATREQHIRREKATSNVCTNSGLCALAATIHLSLLGRKGLAELARLNHARARMLRDAMERAGFAPVFSGPVFNEQAFDVGDAEAVVARLAKRGVAAGAPLARWYPDLPGAKGALLCVATELHTPELIELFARSVRS